MLQVPDYTFLRVCFLTQQTKPGSEDNIIYIYIYMEYFYIPQQLQEGLSAALRTGKLVAATHPEMLPYLKLSQKNPSRTSGAAASPSQSGMHTAEVFWKAPMLRQSREAVGGQDCGAGSDPPQTQSSLKAWQALTLTNSQCVYIPPSCRRAGVIFGIFCHWWRCQ